MPFSTSLKNLLTAFVTVYEKYFSKTFKIALLWTVLCFAIAQTLAAYSSYDPQITIQPVSILSFFVLRFSSHDTYSFVDLVKTVFIFLVAIFSINLIRKQQDSHGKVTIKDILYLLVILIVCGLLDCALFRLDGQLHQGISNKHLVLWMHSVIYLLRIYVPLMLFAVIIQVCTSAAKFNFKKIAFLFVALWIFNEISYELTMLIRATVFNFLMSPLQTPSYRYIAESLLGLPLTACYFLGFYCAMTFPFNTPGETI